MENITIGQVMAGIGIISASIIFIGKLISIYNTAFTVKFKDIDKRLTDLENTTSKQQEDINTSKDERLLLIKGLLACLKGLKEQGCNGAVTQSISELENYLIDNTHR